MVNYNIIIILKHYTVNVYLKTKLQILLYITIIFISKNIKKITLNYKYYLIIYKYFIFCILYLSDFELHKFDSIK